MVQCLPFPYAECTATTSCKFVTVLEYLVNSHSAYLVGCLFSSQGNKFYCDSKLLDSIGTVYRHTYVVLWYFYL